MKGDIDWEAFFTFTLIAFFVLLFAVLITAFTHWLAGITGLAILYGCLFISLIIGFAVAKWVVR